MAAKKSPKSTVKKPSKPSKTAMKKRTAAPTPPPDNTGRDYMGQRREGGVWRANARIAAGERRRAGKPGANSKTGRSGLTASGRAATAANINPLLKQLDAPEWVGIAKDYPSSSRSEFIEVMLGDVVTGGEVSGYPSQYWEPQARQKLGAAWDKARGKKRR